MSIPPSIISQTQPTSQTEKKSVYHEEKPLNFNFPTLNFKVIVRPPAEAADPTAYLAASPFAVCVQCKESLVFRIPFA